MSARPKAAIVGGGVIGGGWAARFLLNGWDVAVFDPDPEAERKIAEVLSNARRALPGLYDRPLPTPGELSIQGDLAKTVSGASWIQESVPERLELKHRVYADILTWAAPDAIIASSTSGFKPSELNVDGSRVIVAHPFNPVYLLPLVELVGAPDICEAAANILRPLGMAPLTLRQEIDAHIADRFLEAVWREALWLIKDGIATTAEIDDAIRLGFGLRWAQMGLFETYRIAGGEAGMAHFLEQFGPALQWPWTKLMDVPDLDADLVTAIARQSDAQSGHLSIRELERLRDDNLVAIMRALKRTGSGAGGVIKTHEAQLPLPPAEGLPITVDQCVPESWGDYNGHMNETHYLELGSFASDRFMEMIGADAAYIASGLSYFTAESHVRYLDEVKTGERVRASTQVIGAEGKKLHLFHQVRKSDGGLAAEIETLLLHVDLRSRKSCPPAPEIANNLSRIAAEHAELPQPEGVGRCVGQRP